MWARTVRYEAVTQENWDIGREWFKNDYLPVARQTVGFLGAYLLHDTERMCTMSVTLWRDEETARASGEAVQQHLDAWEAMTRIKAHVETFEVVHSELPAAVPDG
jgi:heme-degrading monooxygenase HmoA